MINRSASFWDEIAQHPEVSPYVGTFIVTDVTTDEPTQILSINHARRAA